MARYVSRAAASLGTILLLWVCFPSAVGATENQTFGISPFPERVNNVVRRTFAIPLDRGSVFEDAVRVYNRTDQPIELIVYSADARAAGDDSPAVSVAVPPMIFVASNGLPLTLRSAGGGALLDLAAATLTLRAGTLRATAASVLSAFDAEIPEVVKSAVSGKPSPILAGSLARDAIVLCHKQAQAVKNGKTTRV